MFFYSYKRKVHRILYLIYTCILYNVPSSLHVISGGGLWSQETRVPDVTRLFSSSLTLWPLKILQKSVESIKNFKDGNKNICLSTSKGSWEYQIIQCTG